MHFSYNLTHTQVHMSCNFYIWLSHVEVAIWQILDRSRKWVSAAKREGVVPLFLIYIRHMAPASLMIGIGLLMHGIRTKGSVP